MAAMDVLEAIAPGISETADAAVKCASAGSWDRMLSDASTAASLHDDDGKAAAGSGASSVCDGGDLNLPSKACVEGTPDDSSEDDLAASVSVSLAIIVLAAAASAWIYPAAFAGLALLGLVMLVVTKLTDMPCGMSAGGSAQQPTCSGNQSELHESQQEGDCFPDDSRDADLAASVSISLAILGLATALSPWLWPAAFVGLALLGLVALAVVVLTHMPCGIPAIPLCAGSGNVKADLAGGNHAAPHGDNGHGDCPPDDCKHADRAALVSVSCAIVVVSVSASLAMLVS